MFNNKLEEFIDDLGSILGHISEYKMIKASAKLMSNLQPTQNQLVFDQYVAQPYGAFITTKDEAFFLEEKYTDVSGGVVSLLKNVWSQLCADDKESIWNHMKILLILNQRCQAHCEARSRS